MQLIHIIAIITQCNEDACLTFPQFFNKRTLRHSILIEIRRARICEADGLCWMVFVRFRIFQHRLDTQQIFIGRYKQLKVIYIIRLTSLNRRLLRLVAIFPSVCLFFLLIIPFSCFERVIVKLWCGACLFNALFHAWFSILFDNPVFCHVTVTKLFNYYYYSSSVYGFMVDFSICINNLCVLRHPNKFDAVIFYQCCMREHFFILFHHIVSFLMACFVCVFIWLIIFFAYSAWSTVMVFALPSRFSRNLRFLCHLFYQITRKRKTIWYVIFNKCCSH